MTVNTVNSVNSALVETGRPGRCTETETGRGGGKRQVIKDVQGAVCVAGMKIDEKCDVVVVQKMKDDDSKSDKGMMKEECNVSGNVSVSVWGRRSLLDPGRGGELGKKTDDRVSLGGADGGVIDPGHKPRGWVIKSRNRRKSEVDPTIGRSASSLQSKIQLFEQLNQGKIHTEYNTDGDRSNHEGKGDRKQNPGAEFD